MKRKGKMVEKEIHSKHLDELITLKIYLPEAYSTLYTYNLCIMQDGNDYYQLGRIATLSDELHSNNHISNTIFIGIHYIDKFDRRKKYHPDGEQRKQYSAFLALEVAPFLDDMFSTTLMSQSRTLIGDSLAGSLALLTALQYPYTFGRVIMQSPLINGTVLNVVDQSKTIQLIDIYHIVGSDETAVITTTGETIDFITPNRQLKSILEEKDISYHYQEIISGKHTWKYWQKDLPKILTYMF